MIAGLPLNFRSSLPIPATRAGADRALETTPSVDPEDEECVWFGFYDTLEEAEFVKREMIKGWGTPEAKCLAGLLRLRACASRSGGVNDRNSSRSAP